MPLKRLVVLLTLLTLVLSLSVAPLQAQTPLSDELLAEFEAIVQEEMAYYNIPGVAVAVIQGDEIVYTQAFGLRDLETGEPFTTQTQFRIGSTSKSMTSLLIAQLVDEGLISWDTPVTALFPDFATLDPDLTAVLTVRDLMSMGTGLVTKPLSGLEWRDWTLEDLLNSISTMPIGGEKGEFYDYNNEVYALAGYAATLVTGLEPDLASYASLLQTRLFDPLGLESAIITDDVADLSADYAQPYESALLTGEVTLMNNPPIAYIAPAGGVWMHIEDMARYLITQMNGGVTAEGLRIVSEEALAETWQPGVTMEFDGEGIEDTAYGLGWVTQTYRGVPLRFHDGNWVGYSTQMMILPEDDIGLVVFANGTNGALYNYMLSYAFVELLHDLDRYAVEVVRETQAELDTLLGQARGLISLELPNPERLVGTYENGWIIEQRADDSLWFVGYGWEFQLGYMALLDQYLLLNNGGAGTFLRIEEGEEDSEAEEGAGLTLIIELNGEELQRYHKLD